MGKSNLKCLIVDDDELVADILREYIKKVPHLDLSAILTNTISAREKLMKSKIDVLFLDVEMPGLSGIDLLKSLPHKPHVVLMSGNKDYAVEGFNLDVIDFILKPVSFDRFLKSISKVELAMSPRQSGPETPDSIYVNENKRMVRINLSEIYYIESIKDYSRIVLKDKHVITHQQISHFEKILSPEKFIRVHRSVIASVEKIESFSASSIDVGIAELPIGSSYKQHVHDLLRDMTK
jgi:DNA-binding LytR/AlgR family response regulator